MIQKPEDILKIFFYLTLFIFLMIMPYMLLFPSLGHPREVYQSVRTKNNLKVLGHFIMDDYYSQFNKRPQYLRDLYDFAEGRNLFVEFGIDHSLMGEEADLFLAQKDSFGIPILFTETKVGSNETLLFCSAGVNKIFGDDDDIKIYWPQHYNPANNYKLPLVNSRNEQDKQL